MTGDETPVAKGYTALADARWRDAAECFEESLAERITPEALDGLGRSLWWMGETARAWAVRTRAYTAFRRGSRFDEASRIAIWLALEYAAVPGRETLARGWLRRAEGLADRPNAPASGWLALARSTVELDPVRIAAYAEHALQIARANADAELEIRALARSGLALALSGRADEGLARLDEAMTAAMAGEADQPEIFAETCCDMVAACEATLDGRRLEQWGRVAEGFLELRPNPALVSFCGSCCASILAARGDMAGAEHWLTWAIDGLKEAGHESRCVDPRAKLAEIRVSQGKLEEAERLLAGIEARPEAISALTSLHTARGEMGVASSLLHRRLGKIGADSVAAIPILGMLVPIQIDRGDLDGASVAVERMTKLATDVGYERLLAEAALARGRLALARGGEAQAAMELSTAVVGFQRANMPLGGARARLLLASTLAESDPAMAVAEAKAAAGVLDEAGLTAEADRADALIRSLGGRGRVGSKGIGRLTKREQEVLGLVAEGLTNAEIADRLYVSTKTASNHVSNVLTKLNLRSRTEAAAYAHRSLAG